MRLWVLLGVTLVLLAAACGNSTRPAATPTRVTLHGVLTQMQFSCSTGYVLGGGGHVQLTFKDGNGHIIGIATTDPSAEIASPIPIRFGQPCSFSDSYSVSVPKEAFYQVVIEGASQQPAPVSYADVAAKGFELNLTVSG